MLRKSVTFPSFFAAAFYTWSISSLLTQFYRIREPRELIAIYAILAVLLLYLIFRSVRSLLLSVGCAALISLGAVAYNYYQPGLLNFIVNRFQRFLLECAAYFQYIGDFDYIDDYRAFVCFFVCLLVAIPALFFFGRLRGAFLLGVLGVVFFFTVWILGIRSYFPELCAMVSAIMAVSASTYARRQSRKAAKRDKENPSLDLSTTDDAASVETIPDDTADIDSALPTSAEEESGNLAKLVLPWTLVFGIVLLLIASPRNAANMYSLTFEVFLDDLLGISSYFQSNQKSRIYFDITDYGYNEELGGPVELSKDPVYILSGEVPLYLRASIRDVYTGSSWDKSMEYSDYLFTSTFAAPVRADVFAEGLPMIQAGGIDQDTFQLMSNRFSSEIQYTVTLINNLRRAELLTSGRPHGFRSDNINDFYPYYDTNGHVFSRRPIARTNSYTVNEQHINITNAQFSSTVISYEDIIRAQKFAGITVDPYYEWITVRYAPLPSAVGRRVVDYALEATEGISSPYEKMITLRNLLSDQMTHSLEVPRLAPGREFVDWFLEIRSGYCQHFASALAIFARVLGIPSRYVEGFTTMGVTPELDGSLIITGEQAHIWCEIYLEGLGWVPIDATIDYFFSGDRNTYDPTGGLPAGFEHTGTDLWDEDMWTVYTELELEEESAATGNMILRFVLSILVLMLILVMLVAIASYFFRRRYNLERLQLRYEPEEILLRYWRDIRRLIPFLGLTPQAGETSAKLAARVQSLADLQGEKPEQERRFILFDPDAFVASAQVVEHCIYGGLVPDTSALTLLYDLHSSMDVLVLKKIWPHRYLINRIRWAYPKAL